MNSRSAFLVVGLLVVIAGCSGTGPTPTDVTPSSASPNQSANDATPTPLPEPSVDINDVSRLVAHHEEALAEVDYTLHVVYEQRETADNGSTNWVSQTINLSSDMDAKRGRLRIVGGATTSSRVDWFVNRTGAYFKRLHDRDELRYRAFPGEQGYSSFRRFHTGNETRISDQVRDLLAAQKGNWTHARTTRRDGVLYHHFTAGNQSAVIRADGIIARVESAQPDEQVTFNFTVTPVTVSPPSWLDMAKREG